VGLAAGVGVVEIAGLLVAVVVGFRAADGFDPATLLPAGLAGWGGVAAGAFIAFFAFIGFESLANMGEEVRDPGRTLPRGILGAIVASLALYLAVSLASVASGRTSGSLVGLFQGAGATLFALVGTMAVANGVLVQIVVLSRLIFGVARQGQLPAVLAQVHPRTRTPLVATALSGAMVLAMALFLPFERLLALANVITLAIFVLVDLALWRVQRSGPATGFGVPRFVPPLAAALAAGLLVAEVVA
jgi:amino acid transporter